MKAVNCKSTIELARAGTPFSVLILAAGSSGRMGSDKAMLRYDRNASFSKHLVDRYSETNADEVLLVVNEKFNQLFGFPSNVRIITNRDVEFGRSHSIRLGVEKVQTGNACFVQNVDNPYFEIDLLQNLLDRLETGSYVVPVFGERGGHPILLGPQIIDYMRTIDYRYDFREILSGFKKIRLSWEDDGILLNINTPEEYDMYMQSKGKF
jgi:molybdenum cofactor cytidylyltransferase